MTVASELIIEINGRDVGAEALINRVVRVMGQANQTAARTGGAIGTQFSAGVGRATGSALAFQQAQARLEVQQGNLAGAARRLQTALAQQNVTTVQTINAQRQLLTVQTQLEGKTSGLASQIGSSLKGSLLSIVGPLALVSGGMALATSALNSFVEAFNFKAQLDGTTASINSQLKGVRDTTVVWAEAAATARTYRLTQADTNAILASSVDVLRNSKASVGELEIALLRLQSRDPSKPISEAARALRELNSGDVATIKEIFNVGAADALRMKNEIQGGADAVQVLTTFLDRAGSGMDILAQRTTGALGAINDLAIAQEDLTLAQAEFAQGPGLAFLEGKISVIRGATRLLSGDWDAASESIRAAAEGNAGHLTGLVAAIDGVDAAITALANAQAGGTQSAGEWAVATTTLTSSMVGEIDAAVQAGNAIRLQTQATAEATTQAQIDAQAKAALTAEEALLTAQTQAAADAFIALNPNVTASSAAAAAAAAGMSPLIARLIEATLRAQEARSALAAFNALAGVAATAQADFRAGERTGGRARTVADEGRMADAHANTARRAREAAEAEARYQQQIGNATPLLAIRRAELARLTAGSAAYFDKLREIDQIESAAARKSGGGGGRGGAAAIKLSDQQKLNNTLLADQAKADDQAENAEIAHQQKLLDIEREFAERSLQQQRQNETGKRESRGSFYRTLLLDTEGLSPQIEASLSAGYEAAFAKSQELAQAGNAKLAADYLALKEQQLSDEAQYQSDLAKAREDGDKDMIKRLEAVHALETAAAAEKEKQLLAGGDADVAARDKAIAEESERYAEQQGKIGTAAEQAAARKIIAAERAGKAIDVENLKLQQQEQILNRIGGAAPGTAPTGPIPATPAGAPTPAGAVAPVGASLDTLAGLLETIAGAVSSAQAAITRSQDSTTSAVKGLQGRVMG